MLKDTLTELEKKIKDSENIPPQKKDEYFTLLKDLNAEINHLSRVNAEKAESISGFTNISAHEATREEINPNLIQIAVNGLSESVKEFEASYPKLVSTVNDLCVFLSKIGI